MTYNLWTRAKWEHLFTNIRRLSPISGTRDRRFPFFFQFHAFQEDYNQTSRHRNLDYNKFGNMLRSFILQGCEYNEICGSFNSL